MKYILIQSELSPDIIKKYNLKKVVEDHYVDYFFDVDIHTREFLNEIGVEGITKEFLSKENKLCVSFLLTV